MRVRNLLILLLVVVLIASCTFIIIKGIPLGGAYSFEPLRAIQMGLDLTGGVYIVYEAVDPTVDDLDTKIQGAMEVFRNRLDSRGYTEATITRQGTSRIRVEVPIDEGGDPDDVISFIGEPARLQFLDPDGNVIVEGSDIVSAQAIMYDNQPVVSFELSSEAAQRFAEVTQNHVGEAITITLDDVTISSAVINSAIPDGQG